MKTAKTIASVTFLTLGVILIVGSMKYLQLAFRLLDESDVTYALMHALPTEYAETTGLLVDTKPLEPGTTSVIRALHRSMLERMLIASYEYDL